MRKFVLDTTYALPGMVNTASGLLFTWGAKNALEKDDGPGTGEWLMMTFGLVGTVVSQMASSKIKKLYNFTPELGQEPRNVYDYQTKREVVGRYGLHVSAGALTAVHSQMIDAGDGDLACYAWIIGALVLAAGFTGFSDQEIGIRANNDAKNIGTINQGLVREDSHLPVLKRKNAYRAGWLADRVAEFMLVFAALPTMRDEVGSEAAYITMGVSAAWLLRSWIFFCNPIYDATDRFGDYAGAPLKVKLKVVGARRLMEAAPLLMGGKVADDVLQGNFSGDTAWGDSAAMIFAISLRLLFENTITAKQVAANAAKRMGVQRPDDEEGVEPEGFEMSPSGNHQVPRGGNIQGDGTGPKQPLLGQHGHGGGGTFQPEPDDAAVRRYASSEPVVVEAPKPVVLTTTPAPVVTTPQTTAGPVAKPTTAKQEAKLKTAELFVAVADKTATLPPSLRQRQPRLSQQLQGAKSGSPLMSKQSQSFGSSSSITVLEDTSKKEAKGDAQQADTGLSRVPSMGRMTTA